MVGASWLFHEEGCQGGIPFCGSEEVAGSDAEVTMNQHIFCELDLAEFVDEIQPSLWMRFCECG